MLGVTIALAVLLVLVGVEVGLFKFVSKKLAGKSFLAAVATMASLACGVIIGGVVAAVAWKPVAGLVTSFARSTSIDPMIIAVALSLLIITGIWLVFAGVKLWLTSVFEEKNIGIDIAKLVAMTASIYAILDLTAITKNAGGPWWWTSRLMVVISFIAIGRWATNRWFKEKGQDKWGVFVSYTICNVLTTFIMLSVGWSIFANIVGSMYSLSFFLAFNLCLFWLSYGLGDPEKPLHKRLGFYFNCAWMIGLLLVSGLFVVLQASGKLTWFEQETARVTTMANQKVETMERDLATTGLTATLEALDKAVAADDLAEAKKLRKKIGQYNQAQKTIDRASVEKPEAVDGIIKYVASKLTKKPATQPAPSQPVIELKKGDKRLYEISDDGYSPRIYAPDSVHYNLTVTGGKPYEVVFDNGRRVAVVPSGPHINLPTVNPCIFRIYSKEKQGVLVEGN